MECSVCLESFAPKNVSRFDAVIEGGDVQAVWHLYACYLCADKIRGVINTVLRDQATTNAYRAAASELFR